MTGAKFVKILITGILSVKPQGQPQNVKNVSVTARQAIATISQELVINVMKQTQQEIGANIARKITGATLLIYKAWVASFAIVTCTGRLKGLNVLKKVDNASVRIM